MRLRGSDDLEGWSAKNRQWQCLQGVMSRHFSVLGSNNIPDPRTNAITSSLGVNSKVSQHALTLMGILGDTRARKMLP